MPAIGSVHVSSLTYGDATQENTTFEVFNGPITALTIAGFLTQFGALQDATDAIVLGTRRKQSWIGDRTVVSNAYPTNPAAQREAKLRVTYMDTTTEENFELSIGTIDFSKLVFVPGGGDAVIFAGASASTEIKDWVTAFEAMAKSPRDATHAVQVTQMRFVGVNS